MKRGNEENLGTETKRKNDIQNAGKCHEGCSHVQGGAGEVIDLEQRDFGAKDGEDGGDVLRSGLQMFR